MELNSANIRINTKDILKNFDINLPPINRPIVPNYSEMKVYKSAEEIYSRAVSLFAFLCVFYEGKVKREKTRKVVVIWLETYDLVKYLSDYEYQYLIEKKYDVEPNTEFGGRVEALYCLMWILNLTDMKINKFVPNDFVNLFPNIEKNRNPFSLYENLVIKPTNELIKEIDIYYCLQWKLIECKLKNQKFPMNIDRYVFEQRRHSLEWVFTSEPWDEISLDT